MTTTTATSSRSSAHHAWLLVLVAGGALSPGACKDGAAISDRPTDGAVDRSPVDATATGGAGGGGISPDTGGATCGTFPGSGGLGGSFVGPPGSGGCAGATPVDPTAFTWTVNGNLNTSAGHYIESLATTWRSFGFLIGTRYDLSGRACTFWGQFTTVPPPVGTYPIAAWGTPPTDGSFTSVCADGFTEAIVQGPQSRGGQVVISRSEVEHVEGAFTLEATGVSGDITGAFHVGCESAQSSPAECAKHVAGAETGTCAELLACCAKAFSPTDTTNCMASYEDALPSGDAACANFLALARPVYCR